MNARSDVTANLPENLTARAAFASHRLIGWIYWDPDAIARYTALGVPEGRGYYIASRCAPLAAAGADVVAAACYSIHPVFVRFSLETAAAHTTFEAVYEARNDAVEVGLGECAPEIAGTLSDLAPALWRVADELPLAARPMFAAHRSWPRHEERPVLSAWLALNAIREWRGDTHWAVLAAEDVTGVEAGLLHDAYLGYPGDWIPRSRGADDDALAVAWRRLDDRGLVTDGKVNPSGIAFREELERRTDMLCAAGWTLLGESATRQLLDAVEPISERFIERIDRNAGPNWMPAARRRRR